jgi:hypothetical protein
MAEQEIETNLVTGVPKQAFEQFLKKLREQDGISADIVERLSKTLIEQGNISDAAIRAALFGDNDTDT